MLDILMYYFVVPIIIFSFLWEIRKEKNYIEFMKDVVIEGGGEGYGVRGKFADMRDRKQKKQFKKSVKRLRRLQIYMVIALIVLLPLWNFAADYRANSSIHSEIIGGGLHVQKKDPVVHEIGPTFDIAKVYDEIEENPSIYRPEMIKRVVNLDQLTKYPGRLAVYRLIDNRIIITYSYLGVYPVIKAYGFQFMESRGIVVQRETTVVYPLSPAEVSSLADLI
ncbi:MAG: hypothetical protein ACLFVB_04175 [Thermoplasmata archaeon]